MIKMIFIIFTVIFILSGCAVKPTPYDLTMSSTLPPITTKKNIPNIKVGDFKYEPNIRISQNIISHLGCIPCQSDGSTPGFLFEQSVSQIITAEVKSVLDEVIIPTSKSSCTLNATIHLAAFDVMDGDTTVDLTYTLSESQNIKFIKRIRGHHDASLFEFQKVNRILSKASRNSVEQLVTNDEFLKAVNLNCLSKD